MAGQDDPLLAAEDVAAQVLDIAFMLQAQDGCLELPALAVGVDPLADADDADPQDLDQFLHQRHGDDGLAGEPAEVLEDQDAEEAGAGGDEESVEAVAGELGAGDRLVGEFEVGRDAQAEPGGVVAAFAPLVGDALGLLQVGGVATVGRGGRSTGPAGLGHRSVS